MKFSIRGMLLLTSLAALAVLTWMKYEQQRKDMEVLARYRAETEALRLRLAVEKPARHQAILAMHDQFETTAAIRERAVSHFERLHRKYSALEPRGPGTLSLRVLPSLQINTDRPPLVFRIRVPSKRSVWLKCGVTHNDNSAVTLSARGDELLRDSPFTHSGPFETQLTPGDQRLHVRMGAAVGGELPLSITLGEKTLLNTSYRSSRVRHPGLSHISGRNQIDFDPQRNLPGLAGVEMAYESTDGEHTLKLWLDDTPSGFDPYPGE